MAERPRSFQSSHSAPPSPCHTSARYSEPNRRISYTFGQDLTALCTRLPRAADVPELVEQNSNSPQQTPEHSLHIVSASQSSDLQSASENGQLQSYGANFIVNVNCVPESTPTQPGRPRQYGVAPGSELLFAPETIHPDDIRRQHRENCNEREFKVDELHEDLS